MIMSSVLTIKHKTLSTYGTSIYNIFFHKILINFKQFIFSLLYLLFYVFHYYSELNFFAEVNFPLLGFLKLNDLSNFVIKCTHILCLIIKIL